MPKPLTEKQKERIAKLGMQVSDFEQNTNGQPKNVCDRVKECEDALCELAEMIMEVADNG